MNKIAVGMVISWGLYKSDASEEGDRGAGGGRAA